MEPVTVSIVIANYNGETVLPHTLESIKKSDYPLKEIILVDDGSKDKSIEIAQRVLPGIQIIPLGRNTARPNLVRNTGLKKVFSDLILLMDNDIILERDCISRLVEAYEKFSRPAICTPRLLYANDHRRIYTDGQQLHYLCQTIALNRNTQVNSAVHVMEETAG
jgi:glycosyltransferase involved in cell wall biosynthesis